MDQSWYIIIFRLLNICNFNLLILLLYYLIALVFNAASVEKNSLRFILASVAYYFTTGPWRNAWVRIGYDPRQDPQARYIIRQWKSAKLNLVKCQNFVFHRNLQILDYRISQLFKNKVIPKRSYSKYTQPHKFASVMRSKTSTIRQTAETSSSSAKPVKEKKGENSYIYRPGMIPQCRQMFFQVSYQN